VQMDPPVYWSLFPSPRMVSLDLIVKKVKRRCRLGVSPQLDEIIQTLRHDPIVFAANPTIQTRSGVDKRAHAHSILRPAERNHEHDGYAISMVPGGIDDVVDGEVGSNRVCLGKLAESR